MNTGIKGSGGKCGIRLLDCVVKLRCVHHGVGAERVFRCSGMSPVAIPCYWQYDSNMEEMWDERKDRENQRKHGVSFEEAATAFADENARLRHDPDHSQEEDRFLLLGFSAKLRLLVVAHAYRQDGKQIRIVSARKATRNEGKQYGQLL